MKKPNHFAVMSNVECAETDCTRKIKLNLVMRKVGKQLRCFKCHITHEALGGHNMMGKKGLKPSPTFKRSKLS